MLLNENTISTVVLIPQDLVYLDVKVHRAKIVWDLINNMVGRNPLHVHVYFVVNRIFVTHQSLF